MIDYNFDIVATVDFIISMTLLTNQHQYNTVEVPALVDDSNSNKLHNKEKASDIDEVRVLETSSSQTTTSSAAINVNEENTKIVTGMKPPNAELMENSHDANIGSSGDDSQSTGNVIKFMIDLTNFSVTYRVAIFIRLFQNLMITVSTRNWKNLYLVKKMLKNNNR